MNHEHKAKTVKPVVSIKESWINIFVTGQLNHISLEIGFPKSSVKVCLSTLQTLKLIKRLKKCRAAVRSMNRRNRRGT